MSLLLRILRNSEESESGCLLWKGGADSKGYGMISVNGRASYVHRVMYELCKGPITAAVVRHACDVPRCCKPSHLLLGSRGDNIRDAFERGQLKRAVPVEAAPELRKGLISISDFAAKYKVTVKYAYNIKLGHKR